MAGLKFHKVVSSLPPEGELEKDSIYFVRAGNGFDIYLTNSTGLIRAYKSNKDLAQEERDRLSEILNNKSGKAGQFLSIGPNGNLIWRDVQGAEMLPESCSIERVNGLISSIIFDSYSVQISRNSTSNKIETITKGSITRQIVRDPISGKIISVEVI